MIPKEQHKFYKYSTSQSCFDVKNVNSNSLCHVDPDRYHAVAIEKAFDGKYFDYGYDPTIQRLARQVLDKEISRIDARAEADDRIKKLSKPFEIVGTDMFTKEVLENDKPALVYFWGPGHQACRKFSPVVNELASEYEGKIKIFKVNTVRNENKKLPYEYNMFAYPALVLFKSGEMVEQIDNHSNYSSKDDIKKIINNAI